MESFLTELQTFCKKTIVKFPRSSFYLRRCLHILRKSLGTGARCKDRRQGGLWLRGSFPSDNDGDGHDHGDNYHVHGDISTHLVQGCCTLRAVEAFGMINIFPKSQTLPENHLDSIFHIFHIITWSSHDSILLKSQTIAKEHLYSFREHLPKTRFLPGIASPIGASGGSLSEFFGTFSTM